MWFFYSIQDNLARTSSTLDWGVLQAKALALLSAMQHNVDRLSSVGLQDVIELAVISFVSSDRVCTVYDVQCMMYTYSVWELYSRVFLWETKSDKIGKFLKIFKLNPCQILFTHYHIQRNNWLFFKCTGWLVLHVQYKYGYCDLTVINLKLLWVGEREQFVK